MAKLNGDIPGFVPNGLRPPALKGMRLGLWNAGDSRFFTPVVLGAGWLVNLQSASKHPVRAPLFLVTVALLRWYTRERD